LWKQLLASPCLSVRPSVLPHGTTRLHILIRSNKMQQYAGIYSLQNHSKCFGCPSHPSSGVHKTVTAAYGTGHSIWPTTCLERGQIKASPRYCDLYRRLHLQFYVLLLTGAMDTRNMYSDSAVNKYLHAVSSCWILLIQAKMLFLSPVVPGKLWDFTLQMTRYSSPTSVHPSGIRHCLKHAAEILSLNNSQM
jgi:hypothetical protein